MKLNGTDVVVRDNVIGSGVTFKHAPFSDYASIQDSKYQDMVKLVMEKDELLTIAKWLLEMYTSGNYGGYFYLRGELSELEIGLHPKADTD